MGQGKMLDIRHWGELKAVLRRRALLFQVGFVPKRRHKRKSGVEMNSATS